MQTNNSPGQNNKIMKYEKINVPLILNKILNWKLIQRVQDNKGTG